MRTVRFDERIVSTARLDHRCHRLDIRCLHCRHRSGIDCHLDLGIGCYLLGSDIAYHRCFHLDLGTNCLPMRDTNCRPFDTVSRFCYSSSRTPGWTVQPTSQITLSHPVDLYTTINTNLKILFIKNQQSNVILLKSILNIFTCFILFYIILYLENLQQQFNFYIYIYILLFFFYFLLFFAIFYFMKIRNKMVLV